MRAYHLSSPDLDRLALVEVATPTPSPGEVLVRLRAASLNYLDLAVARGSYPTDAFPLIPVADGAGEVATLGEGVTSWAIGDRVIPHALPDWIGGRLTQAAGRRSRGVTSPGSAAQYAVLPAASLIKMPGHLSFAEAATLPIAATTAWNALRSASINPGDTVVLLGTGGVSLFALQLAKASGARVIITSSSDDKLAKAVELGADAVVNYARHPEWDEEVLRLTDGAGADLVVETIGSATFPRSMNAAAVEGTIFVVGFVSGADLRIPVVPILVKTLRIVGNYTGSVQNLEAAARAIEMAGIKPVIDRTFTFDALPDAYRYLAGAGHVGKVVIDVA